MALTHTSLTAHLTKMLCEAYEAQDCAENAEQIRLLQELARLVRDKGTEIVNAGEH